MEIIGQGKKTKIYVISCVFIVKISFVLLYVDEMKF